MIKKMANVFTKKFHRPRTTTLRDFSGFQFLAGDGSTSPKTEGESVESLLPKRRQLRILSPTRRCNPHPTGLVFQNPYNRENQTFDIWNPNFNVISKRMPGMINHLERANFSSGKVLPLVEKRDPPTINYTVNSNSRLSYQAPAELPERFRYMVKKSRFGHTPYKPAQGIVPNTLPPIYCNSPPPKTPVHLGN